MSREAPLPANSISVAAINPIPSGLTLPKIGTLIPNRIFVGGISSNTTEEELRNFFSAFGAVKDVKIIYDKSGLSKGSYGFVTFEDQETAETIIKNEAETLMFKDRKLNIGYAVRKQHIFQKHELGSTLLLAHNTCSLTNGISLFQLCPHEHPILAMNQPAICYPTTLMVPSNLANTQLFHGSTLSAASNPIANTALNSHNANQLSDVGSGSISVNGLLFTPALAANSMTAQIGSTSSIPPGQARIFQPPSSCWKQECSTTDVINKSCFRPTVGMVNTTLGCDSVSQFVPGGKPVNTIPSSSTMTRVLTTKPMQSSCPGHSIQQVNSPETYNIWSLGNPRSNEFMTRSTSDVLARSISNDDQSEVRQAHPDLKATAPPIPPLTQSNVLLMATSSSTTTDTTNLSSSRLKPNETGTFMATNESSLFTLKPEAPRVPLVSQCIKCRSCVQECGTSSLTNDRQGIWQQQKPNTEAFVGSVINPSFASSIRTQAVGNLLSQSYSMSNQNQIKLEDSYLCEHSPSTINSDSQDSTPSNWIRQFISTQSRNYQSHPSGSFTDRIPILRESEIRQLDERATNQSTQNVFQLRNGENRYANQSEGIEVPTLQGQTELQRKPELSTRKDSYANSLHVLLGDNQQSSSKRCSPVTETDQLSDSEKRQTDPTSNIWFPSLPNLFRQTDNLLSEFTSNSSANDHAMCSDVQEIKVDRAMLLTPSSATSACGDISKQRTS